MTPMGTENLRESFYQGPVVQSYRFSRDDREKSKPSETTTHSSTTAAEVEDEMFYETTEASEDNDYFEKSRVTSFLSNLDDHDISKEENHSVEEPNEEEELTL